MEVTGFEALKPDLQLKIKTYYQKKMLTHPNMSRERLLKLVGKKFNIKFEIES